MMIIFHIFVIWIMIRMKGWDDYHHDGDDGGGDDA